MISVIADDFTGAAELAGLGLTHGYSVSISNSKIEDLGTDIQLISTDLRELNREDAALKSAIITQSVLNLKPSLLYKKIDSLLRGNIVAELNEQLSVSKKHKALIIPSNPSLNRTIEQGVFLIEGTPILESPLSKGYSESTKTSHVLDILKERGAQHPLLISTKDSIDQGGIYIGNCQSAEDLKAWANKITSDIIPVGAAEFFGAIIRDSNHHKTAYQEIELDKKAKKVYLMGSNHPKSKALIQQAKAAGFAVSLMPDSIYFDTSYDQVLLDQWTLEVLGLFKVSNEVIIGVEQQPNARSLSPFQIQEILAQLTLKIQNQTNIEELIIEGGATAAAVLKALDYHTFFPTEALGLGITRMRVAENPKTHITVKPGSYTWPKEIWFFDKLNN